MLIKTSMARQFGFDHKGDSIQLPDPDPSLRPAQVLAHFSALYPELTTATVEGPYFDDDVQTFKFVTTIGTKG